MHIVNMNIEFAGPFHKVHHEYAAPFGIAAEYAHPVEILLLGFGTVGGHLVYHACSSLLFDMGSDWDVHIMTMLLWIILRLFQTVDAHSGYNFPSSLFNWMPFWAGTEAGADHHDYHHQAFVGNYASSFRWWDYMFGTDVKYRAFRKRQAEQKRKLKSQ